MKLICWLVFVCLNFWILFLFVKKFERPFLIKGFIFLIPIITVLAVVFMLGMKLVSFQPDENFKNIFFSVFFSLIIICMINLFNQVFFLMVDSIISFHQKNNAANLSRQPIKFFIDNQEILKRVATIVWFLGSALMLYGAWLDKK